MRIAGIIAIAALLTLSSCDWVRNFTQDSGMAALMWESQNNETEWNTSFKLLSGRVNGKLKTGPECTAIVISSEIKKGELEFIVFDEDGSELAKIAANRVDTIRGLQQNAIYRVRAIAKKAGGSFDVTVID